MFERVYKFEIITLGVLTLPTTRVTCSHPMNHFIQIELMPLFFLGNVLMFWDLAITKRKYVYLIALIIYGLFGPIIYNLVFIADGNGDLPVSFFAFLSFYAYLKRSENKYDLKTK